MLSSSETTFSTYPNPGTSLVGRDREIAEVRELVRVARLVTLTGPGGTGKTRLALAVAHEVRSEGRDVAFVDLASIDRPALVPASILAALGLRALAGQEPLDIVVLRLSEQATVLLLDNFEHVMAAVPQIGDILARCPNVSLLITSRARLNLSFERVYDVPPLAYPAAAERMDALATYGSVELFLHRAAEAGGSVAEAELPVVAEICRRLEGLPLAIELAASRARHLSIEALLGRLGEPLPLLSGGPVDVPVRHRALRHTISWSYDLLEPALAGFFADLGVFDGSFGLEAAHAVAGARVGTSDVNTLDALTTLVDQSLVRPSSATSGEPRFVMHEAIGRFAVDVIDDEAAARGRHLAYFVDFAERIEPELGRADQARWTNVLVGDLDNLRGALRWAARSASTIGLLRLAAALGNFWRWHGDLREGQEWLSRAAQAAQPGYEALVAKTQRRAARILSSLGQRDQARLLYEAARRNAEAADDRDGVAESLISIATSLIDEGRQSEAAAFIDQGLALARADGTADTVAFASLTMAVLKRSQGLMDEAIALFEEAAEITRRVGNLRFAAVALVNLADTRLESHDYEAAVSPLTEGVEYLERTGDLAYAPWANLVLGLALRNLGDMEQSRTALDRGAHLAVQVDSPVEMIFAAEALADWLGAAGAHREAMTAWAAASNARDEMDIPRQPNDDHWINAGLERDRSALGRTAASQAWAAAKDLTLRESVLEALRWLIVASPGNMRKASSDRLTLTRREAEVLALLVQGFSDQDIAQELFISPKTASVHVSSIKGKLGANSRVEAVTSAVRLGLVTLPEPGEP
jgi:predicted ATPase/DNA-binding CsgD family transcriptional regulator